MTTQDDVARRLARCSLEEMHQRMHTYGTTGTRIELTWAEVANLAETAVFLEKNGWLLSEYIADCSIAAALLTGPNKQHHLEWVFAKLCKMK